MVWLLQAKQLSDPDKAKSKSSLHSFFLTPGTYSIGRVRGGCDLELPEDESVSRKHADLTVPAQGGQHELSLLVKDASRYGTCVGASLNLADFAKVKGEARVDHGQYLKLGHKSVFRAERLDWSLFLVGPGAEQPAARAALEDAARQAGFTPTASPELCTHVVALGGSPVEVDGALLRALLRGCAVVTPEWVTQWRRRRVWKDTKPEPAVYAPRLVYRGVHGELRQLVDAPTEAAAAAGRRPLQGTVLLWAQGAENEHMRAAAEALGGDCHDAPSSRGRLAKWAAGAVVVRGDPSVALPAKLAHLRWTTPALLLAGALMGSLDGVFQEGPCEGRGHAPASSLAATTASPMCSKRAAGAAAALPTPSKARAVGPATGRCTSNEEAPAAVKAEAPSPAGQEGRPPPAPEAAGPVIRAEVSPAAAAGAVVTATSTRQFKRRRTSAEDETRAPLCEPAAAQRPAAASAERKPLLPLKAEEGWHAKAHKDGAATGQAAQRAQQHRQQVSASDQGSEGGAADEAAAEPGVIFAQLVVSAAKPPSASGAQGPNFKAFRRAVQLQPATPLFAFSQDPYCNEATADSKAFLQAEQAEGRRRAAADALFNASLQPTAKLGPAAKKPPTAAKARAPAAKKAPAAKARAAPAGQCSLKAFLAKG